MPRARASRTVPRATFDDLDAAIAERPPVDDRLVHSLPVASIQPSPRNPRQHVDNIAELADSLRARGQLQNVVVRRKGIGYELIAGHRRLEAAKVLGWTEIAALVRDATDDEAYLDTLTENLQRENLTAREEQAALEVLIRERKWSTRQVGEAIKRSAMFVSRRLRVFDDSVLAPLVLAEQLPVSTAEELLREPDADARRGLAEQAVAEQWTQPAARREVAALRNVRYSQGQPAPRLASRIRALAAELSEVDPDTLSARTRRDLAHLLSVAQRITS